MAILQKSETWVAFLRYFLSRSRFCKFVEREGPFLHFTLVYLLCILVKGEEKVTKTNERLEGAMESERREKAEVTLMWR